MLPHSKELTGAALHNRGHNISGRPRGTWSYARVLQRDSPRLRTLGEALNVPIQLIKRCPRDFQRAKCRVDVKAGNLGNGGVFTLGLGEHKPIRPKPEGAAGLRFGCLVVP